MTHQDAARLGAALGLSLGAMAGLAIYAFALWLAERWNPFL